MTKLLPGGFSAKAISLLHRIDAAASGPKRQRNNRLLELHGEVLRLSSPEEKRVLKRSLNQAYETLDHPGDA